MGRDVRMTTQVQQNPMKPAPAERSLWPIAAVIAITVILAAGLNWSFHHPFPVHWDEALDVNDAQIDTQRLQHGMLVKLAGRLLIKSLGKPPAYRLVALPLLGLVGFHIAAARFVSLACFAVSSLFLYLATRRIAGRAASSFAVLIFCLSPVVVSASIWFSTEGPLYLATSAMFYYLFLIWTDESEHSRSWIGLGLAVALGLLSKASFFAIVVPLMVFAIVVALRGQVGGRSFASLWKAGLLASLVALPWWSLNIKPAIGVAEQARGFVANSLGPPSIATSLRWLSTVFQGLLGYGLGILVVFILLLWVYRAFVTRDAALDPLQKTALWACVAAGLPIVLVQLSGTNHLLRHVSPAMIPLAITVGVLAGNVGWLSSAPAIVFSSILFCVQLGMIVAPVVVPNQRPLNAAFVNVSLPWQVMARREQWDWQPVLTISHDCGIASPKIGYIGMGPTFNPPQIEHPWVAAAGATSNETFPYADVQLLWRFGQGPPDWQKVMDSAEQSDLVMTAPHYLGDLDNRGMDNQYNAEFAGRLSSDQLFRTPISLAMGRFEPVEVEVFVRKSLSCRLPEQAATP
jgi:4-amino-4-deoxy-L-arabinose transferase-like glycosyltransferase